MCGRRVSEHWTGSDGSCIRLGQMQHLINVELCQPRSSISNSPMVFRHESFEMIMRWHQPILSFCEFVHSRQHSTNVPSAQNLGAHQESWLYPVLNRKQSYSMVRLWPPSPPHFRGSFQQEMDISNRVRDHDIQRNMCTCATLRLNTHSLMAMNLASLLSLSYICLLMVYALRKWINALSYCPCTPTSLWIKLLMKSHSETKQAREWPACVDQRIKLTHTNTHNTTQMAHNTPEIHTHAQDYFLPLRPPLFEVSCLVALQLPSALRPLATCTESAPRCVDLWNMMRRWTRQ